MIVVYLISLVVIAVFLWPMLAMSSRRSKKEEEIAGVCGICNAIIYANEPYFNYTPGKMICHQCEKNLEPDLIAPIEIEVEFIEGKAE